MVQMVISVKIIKKCDFKSSNPSDAFCPLYYFTLVA